MARFSVKRGVREIKAGARLLAAGAIRVTDGGIEIIGATTEEIIVQFGKLGAWARKQRA